MKAHTITAPPPPPRSIYACATVDQVKMLGDRILLKPLKWEPSKILEVVRHGRTLRGEVMAVGPGHNPLKYKPGPKGKRQFMNYSRHFRPTEVKVGDIVELGGLNQFDGKGYEFTEVIVGVENMIICTERDVAIVIEPTQEQ
jgi:hypothetical protein